MNTKEVTREQISALADGELADEHIGIALAALRHAPGRADWDIYHQIGDVLRSDDMAVTLSPGFAARMSARLEAEPTIIAPLASDQSSGAAAPQPEQGIPESAKRQAKRWAGPGMAAAAAMAAVAFVATPQLMVAMKDGRAIDNSSSMLASTASPGAAAAALGASTEEHGVIVAASVPEGVVLRDPRIDDYLLAHQRFSPSLYSTAQYARSATFAADSDK